MVHRMARALQMPRGGGSRSAAAQLSTRQSSGIGGLCSAYRHPQEARTTRVVGRITWRLGAGAPESSRLIVSMAVSPSSRKGWRTVTSLRVWDTLPGKPVRSTEECMLIGKDICR